jgi:hypothetical protein
LGTNSDTTLSPLYQRVLNEFDAGQLARSINVIRPAQQEEDEDGEIVEESAYQEHEAAYDAFMTGVVYLGLCLRIKRLEGDALVYDPSVGTLTHLLEGQETRARLLYGRNKIYQLSIFTLDLEEPLKDPLKRGMLPATTYRVSGIDPSVSTRDIVRCLEGLIDSQQRKVNFDIVWVDDTTFLVAACYRPTVLPDSPASLVDLLQSMDTTVVLEEYGRLLRQALGARFTREKVTTLEEHLRHLYSAEDRRDWFSRVLSVLGLRSVRDSDPFPGPPAKKRRLH